MTNIVDYSLNELRSFNERPFNEVDSLVFSQMAYIFFDNVIGPPSRRSKPLTIRDLLKAEHFSAMLNGVRDPENNLRMLFRLGANPRFRDVQVNYYVNVFDSRQAKQFAAFTLILPDESIYVAFRGTDSTIVGWKEDFNMAFITPIPAQLAAVEYLNKIAGLTRSPLRVGGHSKGGNLAVYAAMKCSTDTRNRLLAVYSHDGPGFNAAVITGDDFSRIAPLVHKTLPQSSLIGMLLQTQENYRIVESDRFWIMQHDPFSWRVKSGDFVYADKLDAGSNFMNQTLNKWINGMSDAERALFTDALFSVLEATQVETFNELTDNWAQEVPKIINAIKGIEPSTKKQIDEIVRELVKMALYNLLPEQRPHLKISFLERG